MKKTSHPLISIIIPVYNVEKYLNRCMESVINQSLKNIEIILVDDGSPDNCPQLCDEWAAKDSRIKVVHKNNEGLGLARNTGMQYATGEYLAFIDSDDYVDLRMYEILYEKATALNADIVYCGHKYGLKDGTFEDRNDFSQETIFDDKAKIEEHSMNYFYPINSRQMMMSVWHSIYKRDIIKTPFYSEREVVSEDLHFQLSAILNSKKIVYIPDSLYYYCYNGESLSHTFKFNKFYGFQKLMRVILNLYPKKERYVYKYYFNLILGFIRHIMGDEKLTNKERKEYIKEIYLNETWQEIKQGTDKRMYVKHHKLMYALFGRNMFYLFHLILLFDYYFVYRRKQISKTKKNI